MAKIIIVDENDKAIGSKEREKAKEGDIYRVTGLWLTNSKGQILLAQRKSTKKNNPGCWGPAVAGTVEEGESYDSNIKKEIKEELGRDDFETSRGPYFFSGGEHNKFVQYYLAETDLAAEEFIPQEEEVEQVAWFDIHDIKTDLKNNPEKFTPSISRLLELLY